VNGEPGTNTSPKTIAAALKLLAAGYTIPSVAKQLGLSQSGVRNWKNNPKYHAIAKLPETYERIREGLSAYGYDVHKTAKMLNVPVADVQTVRATFARLAGRRPSKEPAKPADTTPTIDSILSRCSPAMEVCAAFFSDRLGIDIQTARSILTDAWILRGHGRGLVRDIVN
jgi:hypothetical protein